ncbi:MAG: hypothetical protein H0X51_03915 [Parachlamydiaceae bacterium]|nr:hypothetical protein [Parachlamydiaceae bacterium]
MSSRDPLDRFLDELTDLMRLLQVNQSKNIDKIPDEVEEKLTELEGVAARMRKVNEETFKGLGLTEEQLEKALHFPENLTAEEKRTIERSLEISREVTKTKAELTVAVTIAEQRKKNAEGSPENIKARKKRFRPMGGKKHWKPM